MAIREFECPKCGLVKELLINSNQIIPKTILKGCDNCQEDLNYKLSVPGFHRNKTIYGE